MAFDVLILAGDEEAPDLVDLATSLQIVQSIDDMSRFTMRLDIDIDECGDFPVLLDPRLAPGAELAFVVPDCKKPTCIIRGPIDSTRVHIQAGGGGSWIEVSGGDRRVAMDRVHVAGIWSGNDKTIVETILDKYELEPDVADTERSSDDKSNTRNQSSTDHEWIQRIASQNPGFRFWITYDLEHSAQTGYKITEHGHFKPSPPRLLNSKIVDPFIDPPPRLDINLGDRTTQSMVSIDIEYDAEKPTKVNGHRVSAATNELVAHEIPKPPNDPLGGLPLKDFATGERTIFLPTAGDAGELELRGQAALADEEWFLRATISATRYSLLGRIVQPHMIVPIVGLGSRYSGDWFITGVTHSIDNRNHTMSIEIARNALKA